MPWDVHAVGCGGGLYVAKADQTEKPNQRFCEKLRCGEKFATFLFWQRPEQQGGHLGPRLQGSTAMKIVGLILAALMLIGSAFVGVSGSNKSMELSSEIGAAADVLSEAQMKEAGLPSAGRLKFGAMIGIVAAIGALVLVLVMVWRSDKVVPVAGVTMACCLCAIALYPSIGVGPTEGLAPRMQAVIALVLAAVGACGALLATRPAKKI